MLVYLYVKTCAMSSFDMAARPLPRIPCPTALSRDGSPIALSWYADSSGSLAICLADGTGWSSTRFLSRTYVLGQTGTGWFTDTLARDNVMLPDRDVRTLLHCYAIGITGKSHPGVGPVMPPAHPFKLVV